jgi:FkbH-like protein
MIPIRHWIDSYPDLQKEAILDALASSSLARINRALRLVEKLGTAQPGPVFYVELVSTYNLEPMQAVLQLALNCLPSRACLHLAPLDTIEASISQNAAGLLSPEGFNARAIIWRLEELMPEAFYPFSNGFPDKLDNLFDQLLLRVERVVRLHRQNAPGIPLFLATISFPLNVSNPLSAAQHSAGIYGLIGRINQKIYQLVTNEKHTYVLDVATWAAREGRLHAAAALEFMARQPFSASGQTEFALFLARSLRPLIVPRRKALAVDLDNSLWGGVLGEDGLHGLKLGHEFPGNVHLRMQRELLELKARGIVLVLLSKNNESDVREAFAALPEMLMKWEDFALCKINWKPKHENLRAAADELNLGLDSFAFLDDSDYEREQMRQFIPEVLILNDSSDPIKTVSALWETDAFDSLVTTDEDRLRHHDYQVRAARASGAHQDDLKSFLQSLGMKATIERIGPPNIERAVTMLGKTNQFNLTTRRHSIGQLERLIELPGSIAMALRLRDKFGEQGIVALLIALPTAEPGTFLIDSFLVSCRALGRGVEKALWAAMLKAADKQGIQELEAEYIATAKNGMVVDFYDQLGLTRISQDCSVTRYRLRPVEWQSFPDWIAVTN